MGISPAPEEIGPLLENHKTPGSGPRPRRARAFRGDLIRLLAFKVDRKERGGTSLSHGKTQALAAISEFGAKPRREDEKMGLSEIVKAFNERHGALFRG